MEEKLEDVIQRIASLKEDLSAQKVDGFEQAEVQELVCDGWSTGSRTEYRTESMPIFIADEAKREAAKSGLEQLYCSSDWYTARHAAGMALGMPQDRLKDDLKRWKVVLKKDLRLPKTELKDVGKTMYTTSDYAGKVWDSEVVVPDFKKVKNYENIQKISKAREDMKGLGYSSMSLFALRHPVAAIISAAAAVSGAGYVLVQYLSK